MKKYQSVSSKKTEPSFQLLPTPYLKCSLLRFGLVWLGRRLVGGHTACAQIPALPHASCVSLGTSLFVHL